MFPIRHSTLPYSHKNVDVLFFRAIHSSVDVFIQPMSNQARHRSKSTCQDLMKSRLRISRNYGDSRSRLEFKCCRIWRRPSISSYVTAWMDLDFESIDHGKDNRILCGRRWNFDVVSRSRRIHSIKYVNIYCYIFYSLIISCYFRNIVIISHAHTQELFLTLPSPFRPSLRSHFALYFSEYIYVYSRDKFNILIQKNINLLNYCRV